MVVAALLGTELNQFLAAQAILQQDDLKIKDSFILFFISSWCNSSYSLCCPGSIHPIPQLVLT